MKKLILASASPRRRELLLQLGIPFTVMVSGVAEENPAGADPSHLAVRLALVKAESVGRRVSGGLVLAADTVVAVEGKLLGKPRHRAEAAAMLRTLSGRWHEVLTGVALLEQPGGRKATHVERTLVHVRRLLPGEIDWYVDSGEPYDKAGGYGIQGRAAVFVDRIEGCYFNVVGLPLAALWQLLARFGICIREGAGGNDITAPDHQGAASE